VGYGGKDLQKRKVLSLEWKSEGDDESGELMELMEEVPYVAFLRAGLTLMIGPVVVGNVVDSNVSNYRLCASERQQLSYGADATPVCYLCGVARAQPPTNHGLTCNTR